MDESNMMRVKKSRSRQQSESKIKNEKRETSCRLLLLLLLSSLNLLTIRFSVIVVGWERTCQLTWGSGASLNEQQRQTLRPTGISLSLSLTYVHVINFLLRSQEERSRVATGRNPGHRSSRLGSFP
jgi:hypothetical protein